MPRFNPLPARGPGDTRRKNRGNLKNEWFQSAPGPGAGRYDGIALPLHSRLYVSIRSRPGGREIRHLNGRRLTAKWFQSAPGPGAGRYREGLAVWGIA